MSRKAIPRGILPLPRKPRFLSTDNKTERLLVLLRELAVSSQRPEAQLFYSLREVARKCRVPISLGAKIYRELEREGILKRIRGSGTILEGLNPTRKVAVRGIIAIASSLPRFLTQRDYRTFLMQMHRELRERDFAAADVFFEAGEMADEIADRLKKCCPDRVIWYCPEKPAGEVALRLHDVGVSIIGVSDAGFPRIHCQYAIARQLAVTTIVDEWKKQAVTWIKVAVGPVRSAADEERVGRTLEDLDVGLSFVSLRSQTLAHLVHGQGRGPKCGVVLSASGASFLAMCTPEALARLARSCRVALVGGPVSDPFAKLMDVTVELVAVDWRAVAKRIVEDLSTRRDCTFEASCVFEARALFAVPLNEHAQRL